MDDDWPAAAGGAVDVAEVACGDVADVAAAAAAPGGDDDAPDAAGGDGSTTPHVLSRSLYVGELTKRG